MDREKKHTAEQIVNLMRKVEVGAANRKTLLLMIQEELMIGHTQRSGLGSFQPAQLVHGFPSAASALALK